MLPSVYSGGDLLVRHQGEERRLMEASATDGLQACTISFAAFYCDLEHELLPVTGGLRLCLAYNLVRRTGALTAPVAIKVCAHNGTDRVLVQVHVCISLSSTC